jgi:hypothetical protein
MIALTQKLTVPQVILFVFVVVLRIEIGGGLFDTLVVISVWAAGPP